MYFKFVWGLKRCLQINKIKEREIIGLQIMVKKTNNKLFVLTYNILLSITSLFFLYRWTEGRKSINNISITSL